MNTTGIPQPTPIQDELRAVISVRSHGEQERVARVAGLCPRHLSNALNPDQPHALRPDAFVAVVRAGRALGVPGMAAYAEHLRSLLSELDEPHCNGVWTDEATAGLCELSSLLRSHCRTPEVAALSPAARKEIMASTLRGLEMLTRLLQELQQ